MCVGMVVSCKLKCKKSINIKLMQQKEIIIEINSGIETLWLFQVYVYLSLWALISTNFWLFM